MIVSSFPKFAGTKSAFDVDYAFLKQPRRKSEKKTLDLKKQGCTNSESERERVRSERVRVQEWSQKSAFRKECLLLTMLLQVIRARRGPLCVPTCVRTCERCHGRLLNRKFAHAHACTHARALPIRIETATNQPF